MGEQFHFEPDSYLDIVGGYDIVVRYVDVPVDTAVARAAARRQMAQRDAHVIAEADIRHMLTIVEPPQSFEASQLFDMALDPAPIASIRRIDRILCT